MNRDLKLNRRNLIKIIGGAALAAAAVTQVHPPPINLAEFPMGIHPDELVVDNFAGGGGASTGIEWALGRPVDIAINHDRKALALHAANHPRTRHLCDNVWRVDIRKEVGDRRVGMAWFSPDCTFFSKARGQKPIRQKGKEIRGLAWVALRWAGMVKPRVIFLENVEEFQNWGMVHRDREGKKDRGRCKVCKQIFDGRPCPKHKGVTFKRWCTQLRNLGYEVEFKERRAMVDGAPTIRKRLFVIARCDGQPIVWPEATHGPGLLPYRTAAECIDFSIPCPSIFLSKKEAKKLGVIRPLVEKSMMRIAKGVRKYVLDSQRKPFLVTLTHAGGDRVNDVEDPFRTITGANRGEIAVVDAHIAPFIGTYYGSNRPGGDRTASTEHPLRTQSTENRFALVSAFLARQFGKSSAAPADQPIGSATEHSKTAVVAALVARTFGQSVGSGADESVGSITADGGGHTAVIAAHLAQHNGERTGVKAGRPIDVPSATATTTGRQISVVTSHIMKMRGTNIGSSMEAPLHTISSKGLHHAEVRTFLQQYLGGDPDDYFVEINGERWVIVDIGMRMLTPRELFRAQGFPDSYIIEGGRDVCNPQGFLAIGGEWIELTNTDQIRMCGNSVSPYSACALVRAQFGGEKIAKAA